MLGPQSSVTEDELRRGLRNLLVDASFATAIGALNSGVVLLALALHIGASNIEIGLLAAIPLFTQILQAPAVTLVERLRARRRISVVCVFLARLALPVYAAIPFIQDRRTAAAVLIAAALVHYGFNAVGACSWNSWMRDLVPSDRLGRFFSRRTMYGTAVSALATVGGALALERTAGDRATGDYIFAALYLFGFGCGLVSTAALARVPEPRMPASSGGVTIFRLLAAPLRDPNFRSMLRYLASWQFAVNLATPFFTVYFVRELGFSMGFVLVLSFISQMANLAVIRGWGVLSDRFANKSVLGVATPLFILCIAAMAFASEIHGQSLRAAYLVVLHVVMGAAGAGVGLASGNIVLKLSPPSGATGFMASNAMIGAIAAGIAPVIGGWASDFFAARKLSLALRWTSPSGASEFGVMFTHLEFFFLISAAMGLYTMYRLAMIREPGAVGSREVVSHILSTAARTLGNASSVSGLRNAMVFPGGELIKLRELRIPLLENLQHVVRERFGWGSRESMLGSMLDASFETPTPEPSLDDLLAQLK
ncbi:MFS transporter [Sphingomonas psychrotolerans]|uniref:MFS transporter n=1 Tax=Sphingomonas psychrotolerans TaxID=1327635 RepID=A0ABU3N5P2_9SPHN|nr:MFS transporter [Sphingomonas psychrotolerans]MDT8759850.1 MFS transporter [Sphingomonas psychrotolerans]